MRRKAIGAGGLLGLFVAVVLAIPSGLVSAAPQGAATGLSFDSESCQNNGVVTGRLSWSPSGLGSQWVDLALDAGFANHSRGGPFSASTSSVNLTQLKEGTTYYARVLTVASGVTLASDPLTVRGSCDNLGGGSGPITKPTGLNTQVLSGGGMRFDWTAGDNNRWFCVDTARTLGDLVNTRNTWRNHGCWTTSSELTVSGLSCGTPYYWLVYAWNATGNVKSDPKLVQTGSCASTISPPANLSATVQSDGDIFFDWTAGSGNRWYCVDTAKSLSDLQNLSGTWRNHGCWSTASHLEVSGLDCETTYYWLVYAWNEVANTKSTIATVESRDCKVGLELAPIEDVEVVKNSNGTYTAEIRAVLPNTCHEPDAYQVRQFGNEVEITVWNEVREGVCAFVYEEYELNVNLGDDFDMGETYEVIVNDDESDTFVAS